MRCAVVLAAHAAPATDYPPRRVGQLMAWEFSGKLVERVGFLRTWRDALDHEVRAWPRTPENDPYKAANEHTGREIRAAVVRASGQHPAVDMHYAWPFDQAQLITLLAEQAAAHVPLTEKQ